MKHVTYEDMQERAASKHVIAEELNIVVANTRALALEADHKLERLQQQLRILEEKLR